MEATPWPLNSSSTWALDRNLSPWTCRAVSRTSSAPPTSLTSRRGSGVPASCRDKSIESPCTLVGRKGSSLPALQSCTSWSVLSCTVRNMVSCQRPRRAVVKARSGAHHSPAGLSRPLVRWNPEDPAEEEGRSEESVATGNFMTMLCLA